MGGERKRQCFAVFPTQFVEGKGYVPSLVTEDEPGHQPLIGRDELAEPWYWGTDMATAQRTCDEANAKDFGLTPEHAKAIVDSSITAQIRQDAGNDRRRRRMEQVFRTEGA